MSTSTAAPATHTWVQYRDDYGRACHELYRLPSMRQAAVVVKLPAAWLMVHPDQPYLLNVRVDGGGPGIVTYHRSRRSAKRAALEAIR